MSVGSAHIRLLGAFEVVVDGRTIEAERWSARRAAELVQLLALSADHRLLRDQVIEALWPHLDVEAGAANLRKAAHLARRAIGDPDAVTLHQGQVALFPTRLVTTDAAAFTTAAEQALAHGDADAAQTIADDYLGDLLPTSLYDDWAEPMRHRLRDLHGDLLRLGGRWDRVLVLDPTDEEAARALMREALSTGRRHTAISCYGRLRTALRTELGVRPSAETEGVYDECVRGLIVADSTFVGRQLELSTIRSRLQSGTAAIITVCGPAGIGKSALCQEATNIAGAEGWRAITVTAGASEGPYATLTDVIEQVMTTDPGALDTAGERARSVLAELSPMIEPTSTIRRQVTRHQVIGAVRRLLTAVSGGRGTLLFIDDAHAADAATIEALLHVVAVAAAPILIMLAYRPEAASGTLRGGVARLARAGSVTALDLGPFAYEEARALAVTAGLVDREETISEIVKLAEGNPFFVLELVKSTVDDGRLRIATSLQDATAARFASLDDGTAALLRRLALSGNDLDLLTVMALTGADDDDAFIMLDTALASGVLVVVDGRYRFGHQLVRQAMIAEIAPHHRVAIHRDAARRLTAMNGAPANIARHWLDGNQPDLAAPWLLSAARRSVELAAFRDALQYLEPLLHHDPAHADALLLRAESLEALGEIAALSAYAAAARASGEPAAQEIVPRQALAQIKQGDPAGALRTLSGSTPVTVQGRLAEALTIAGAAALGFGDPVIGAAKAAESRRLALQTGDSASLVTASWANAAAAHARGDLRGSVRIDLEETQNLPHLAINVFDGQLCITQRLLYGARPYADVIAFADSLGSEAHRLGAARGYAFARTLGGEAKLLAGRLDEAEDDLRAAQKLHHEIAASAGEAFSLQRRAEVAIFRGDLTGARALLDDALAVAQESEVGFHLFDRIYGARIIAVDSPEAGLAALEAAEAAVLGPAETCPGCRITLSAPAAIAAARAGDLERASQYEKATAFLAEVVMRLPAWYAALDEVRGHITRAEGDFETSSRHFACAADGYRAAEQPLDQARCHDLINPPT